MKIYLVSLLSLLSMKLGGAQDTCFEGDMTAAGSTTVEPLASAWGESYTAQCPTSGITVEGGGSSAGAARVCGDSSKGTSVDIGNMSRDWKTTEATAETEGGWMYKCLIGDTTRVVAQFPVAWDGVSVVVKAASAAETCITGLGGLTMDQLRWMFTNYTDSELEATGWDASSLTNSDGDESTHMWSELVADCPALEVMIAGEDAESGTYEFFMQTVLTDYANGEGFRSPYYNSTTEDDVATYIAENDATIGYLNYATYMAHESALGLAAIENSEGSYVSPSATTITDGTYNPLARKVYMNLLKDCTSMKKTLSYLEYGYSSGGDTDLTTAGLVPLTTEEKSTLEGWIAEHLSECQY